MQGTLHSNDCTELCAGFWYSSDVFLPAWECEAGGEVVMGVSAPATDFFQFAYEADLVEAATCVIAAGLDPWGTVEFGLEFDYRRGRTDIICVSRGGEIIAIEAKLRDWREAMHQAYRNSSFAAESYVLLPEIIARRAALHPAEFQDRGVGICTVSEAGFEILLSARKHSMPLEPALRQRAAAFASA